MYVRGEPQDEEQKLFKLLSVESKRGGRFYTYSFAYHNHKEICACAHTHTYIQWVVSWVMWLGNIKYVIIVPESNSICNLSVVLLCGRMSFQPALLFLTKNHQKNVWLYIPLLSNASIFSHIPYCLDCAVIQWCLFYLERLKNEVLYRSDVSRQVRVIP